MLKCVEHCRIKHRSSCEWNIFKLVIQKKFKTLSTLSFFKSFIDMFIYLFICLEIFKCNFRTFFDSSFFKAKIHQNEQQNEHNPFRITQQSHQSSINATSVKWFYYAPFRGRMHSHRLTTNAICLCHLWMWEWLYVAVCVCILKPLLFALLCTVSAE